MKPTSQESNTVHMPPELLAAVREAATEEHRPADELVSDAVRRYLRERKPSTNAARQKSLAQFLMDSPLAGANLDLERHADGKAAEPVESRTGADLIAALQSSPYRDTNIEPARYRLPARNIAL